MEPDLPEAPPSQHPRGSLAELLHVATPLVISSGSLSLMNVVDRVFLAKLSVDALAASMPAAMLSWTCVSLFLGMAGYTGAFLSQYEGAGKKDRVMLTLWQGIFMSLFGGCLLLPMIWLCPIVFRWMDHPGNVQRLEIEYFSVLCPVAIPILLSTVLSAYFAARKRTTVVMWVNVFISAMNIILDYLLIFGIGPFPELGIRGAALATVMSSFAGSALFWMMLVPDAKRNGYPLWETLKADLQLLRRMIRFGFPNGVQFLLDIGAFTMFIILIGKLGTLQQAATNVAFTLNSMAFIPTLGMGNAVLTIVGLRVGEGDAPLAARTVWKAFILSGFLMILFSAVCLLFPQVILSPFLHADEKASINELQPIVMTLLQFVALYTFFDAMAIIFGSAVRGAGDTMFSLLFTVTCGWLLMVMPTLWIVQQGGSLYQCWTACTSFVIVIGLGFLARFLHGKWKSMQVIEREGEIAI